MKRPNWRSLALSICLGVPLAAPLVAQTVEQELGKTPVSTLTEARIFPFGDGFTTAKQARALLAEQGLEYITHFGCRGAACHSEPSPTLLRAGRRSEITQFELTGFHPRLGAVTYVLLDVSCEKGLRVAVKSPRTRGPVRCFAGYEAVMRSFHDVGLRSDANGYSFSIYQRIEVPGRMGQGNGLWQEVGTLENHKTVEGVVRSGQSVAVEVRLVLPDGTVASEDVWNEYRIADSDNDDDTIDLEPVVPKGGGTPQTRVAISSELEKSELCAREAEAKAAIGGQSSEVLALATTLLTNGIMLGMRELVIGSGDSPGGNLTIRPPDFDSLLQRNAAAAVAALEAQFYLDCMDREGGPAPVDPGAPTGISLILVDGEGDQSVEVVEIEFSGTGGSCESWSTEESEEQGSRVCTTTVTVDCDADCNCTRNEATVCTDLDP